LLAEAVERGPIALNIGLLGLKSAPQLLLRLYIHVIVIHGTRLLLIQVEPWA
jgi:hypothetical protein